MKVLRVEMLTSTTATIILRPNWIARLFGAKDLKCELERRGARKGHDEEDGPVGWRDKYTGTRLGWMKWGSKIQCALQYQPHERTELPEARIHGP